MKIWTKSWHSQITKGCDIIVQSNGSRKKEEKKQGCVSAATDMENSQLLQNK